MASSNATCYPDIALLVFAVYLLATATATVACCIRRSRHIRFNLGCVRTTALQYGHRIRPSFDRLMHADFR
jgi:hypothetical protein